MLFGLRAVHRAKIMYNGNNYELTVEKGCFRGSCLGALPEGKC